MAEASRWHDLIVANVIGELRLQLKGRPCTTYPSDMRVKISPTGLYTYPDVTVVCGEAQFEDTRARHLTEPNLDCRSAVRIYGSIRPWRQVCPLSQLPTLLEYVLITQTKPHIKHYIRQPDNRWLLEEAEGLHGTVHFPAIDCHLSLAEAYDKVDIVVVLRYPGSRQFLHRPRGRIPRRCDCPPDGRRWHPPGSSSN